MSEFAEVAMKLPSEEPTFRTRVRYAECSAHGELTLATYINYFTEAAAQALRQIGLDAQALTARDGLLREAAITVNVQESPAYDDQVQVLVRLDAVGDAAFSLRLELRRQYRGSLLAEGRIRFVTRLPELAAAAALPPHLTSALERLPQ